MDQQFLRFLERLVLSCEPFHVLFVFIVNSSCCSFVLHPLFCGAANLHSAGGPSLCKTYVTYPARLPDCVCCMFYDPCPELILIAILQLDAHCLNAGDVRHVPALILSGYFRFELYVFCSLNFLVILYTLLQLT